MVYSSYTQLGRQQDELLDLKEDVIDPIRKFMSGSQKEIYNEARSLLQTQEPNFIYVPGEEVEAIRTILNDPHCYKGSKTQQLKGHLDQLKGRIEEKVNQTRAAAEDSLQTMQERMQGMDEYQSLPEPRQAELNKPFKDLRDNIREQKLIAVINDRLRYFEDTGYQNVLSRMVALNKQATEPVKPSEPAHDVHKPADPVQAKESPAEYVQARNLKVAYSKAWLATEEDVDRYLESLKDALLKEVQQGRKVQI